MFYSTLKLALVASLGCLILTGCACSSANPATGQPERLASVQNAGPTFNAYAAAYSFDSYPQSFNTTWADAYNGSDFNADFAAILHDVSAALGVALPPFTGSGKINVDLENWPDS